ncbi:hypothetical protein AB0C61_20560 [Streptomyces sp. NPDC048680]|uniref:hypothetical protein n=1 Tax=Streptomyces sp. NPDC048680 TaxID=3155492 RepID=UPI003425713F
MSDDQALALLTAPAREFVDISVQVRAAGPDTLAVTPQYVVPGTEAVDRRARTPVGVRSTQVDHRGTVLNDFGITWAHATALATEYNWGLSLFHDVKDHRLYGLGITPLTEIQALVQTLYGRACAAAGGRPPEPESWRPALFGAIHDELFGPRGPRVYDPRARGLLVEHCPGADEAERQQALAHMWLIATKLMLPPLVRLYAEHDTALALQRPLRQMNALVRQVLSGVVWADEEHLLLRLADNIGLARTVRARVDPDLALVTGAVLDQVREYVDARRLADSYGPIFDCTGYALASRTGL